MNEQPINPMNEQPSPPAFNGDPSITNPEERKFAIFAHLSAFGASLVALPFLGPLIMYLVKEQKESFGGRHVKEALNFNLSMLLYYIGAFVLIFVFIGILLLPALFVLWVIFTIIASVKASNREEYRYPLTIRFVK